MSLNKPLAKNLRSQLENTVKTARDVAEKAAQAALIYLGVGDSEAPSHLTEDQKALRRRLRAHGRQLGDIKHANDTQPIRHLVWEVAYEHWHRMLFARFLAENNLLMWEPGAVVTLAECEELAQDLSVNLGAKSGWELSAILAARMLPQVFKPHSPVFELRFSPNEQRDLELLLKGLPTETFQASDSLGWVYQFWQAQRKEAINKSEVKIGADELPAVTQLFTEPYMVDFLLHNSLGAWWHTRHPSQACPVELTYFRTLDDGTPAAGKFEGWPDSLADFTLLDPCCGSGHFIVAAFLMLVPMRMVSEGLSTKDAVDGVLADNLHGLEIDPRCVEIAVFALALAAWRYPDESGNALGVRIEMPAPNIACCGLKVAAKAQDWEALVPNNVTNAAFMRQELRLLHNSFAQAPLLGSLLDPSKTLKNDLASSNSDSLKGFLEQALSSEFSGKLNGDSDDAWDLALAAQGLLKAANILEARYHLVITNVPYLKSGNQSNELKAYCEANYPDSKYELAAVFMERCTELLVESGVSAIVTQQYWLFLSFYERLRRKYINNRAINLITTLGTGAFESISGEVVNVCLQFYQANTPKKLHKISFLDVSGVKASHEKSEFLKKADLKLLLQNSQLNNPDARINSNEITDINERPLSEIAEFGKGSVTGDSPHYLKLFWEVSPMQKGYVPWLNSPDGLDTLSGREYWAMWNIPGHNFQLENGYALRGQRAWGNKGIALGKAGRLRPTLYLGELFDDNLVVLFPKQSKDLELLWNFCKSADFEERIRILDKKMSVTAGTFTKVLVNQGLWNNGNDTIPDLESHNPTQWLFHGHPCASTDPLQVGIARLLGCAWPAESDKKMELSDDARTWIERCKDLENDVDDDGIVCLRAVRGEKPAHERLLTLLINAWETVEPGSWKTSVLDKLLADADSAGKGLDVWLQEKFFEQHAKLFQHRPFIWHVWDGLKDGFSALVNYHKLDTKNLERLIHTYLGDWIRTQEAEVTKGIDGAELRLAAAQALKKKLEAILEGEAPYDIFVRWKSLAQQPIGWNPDLNDGVRMNIRPFMTAEVLRHNKKPKLNITWDKDRGKDVISAPWYNLGLQYDGKEGDRINDHHLTLAQKRSARAI